MTSPEPKYVAASHGWWPKLTAQVRALLYGLEVDGAWILISLMRACQYWNELK